VAKDCGRANIIQALLFLDLPVSSDGKFGKFIVRKTKLMILARDMKNSIKKEKRKGERKEKEEKDCNNPDSDVSSHYDIILSIISHHSGLMSPNNNPGTSWLSLTIVIAHLYSLVISYLDSSGLSCFYMGFMPDDLRMGLVETIPYVIWRFVELGIMVKPYTALFAQKHPVCPFSFGVGPFILTFDLRDLLGTFVNSANLPCGLLESRLFETVVCSTAFVKDLIQYFH
jgi:hypothetical protein